MGDSTQHPSLYGAICLGFEAEPHPDDDRFYRELAKAVTDHRLRRQPTGTEADE